MRMIGGGAYMSASPVIKSVGTEMVSSSANVTRLRKVCGGGCALVFAPVLAAEAALAERGNVELVDREGGATRRQRIDDALAERYRAAYARHFALWEEAAKRAATGFARIACDAGALTAGLAGEARARGVVEVLA